MEMPVLKIHFVVNALIHLSNALLIPAMKSHIPFSYALSSELVTHFLTSAPSLILMRTLNGFGSVVKLVFMALHSSASSTGLSLGFRGSET